jgi:hypothetical protein
LARPARSLHVERFIPKALTEPVLTEAFEVYKSQERLSTSAAVKPRTDGHGAGERPVT